ncbi:MULTISPECIES: RsmB/NOP family class I SAM-dependent RNA methyltransferase [Paenibacillus]|uniref:RsmB/NOP family class I SAM-dependent RNA methyltransferase n=1 Tax=Paenibacillus TaxID=44249 RepID=UPI0022B87F96|nr:RsmB/NOP family class I SAM-dependent RNA methyltransferase [Paenibacillus caseinilyticus]MCZ8517999.1 RsmB/NOP family class I SAM-dependent RNA methyltransferase [Paenibacillus caseinilyticus]
MTTLPSSYIEQMRKMLGEESGAFLDSYGLPRTQGLRINPRKINPEEPGALLELQRLFALEPVPWCPGGYYYPEDSRPGRHPYHAAGVYYIQEPSAMSAVELLDPQPGDIVLDLAAAPGGKSTHIAGKLAGEGLLISNEIHPARAKILAENIERMGIANAVVVSSNPPQLAARFPRFFDRIMVDAPCSGEGMFRKDPDAVAEWSPAHVEMCAARQLDILQDAVRMLKPGGTLAYSTCTFNRLENEETAEAILKLCPGLELERTERIWPHRHRGEGHFVAVFRLTGTDAAAEDAPPAYKRRAPARAKRGTVRPEEEAVRLYERWSAETWAPEGPAFPLPPGEPFLYGEQLYWLPQAEGCPFDGSLLQGLKVLRPGLHLAEVKKNRVEPAHALALALPKEADVQLRVDLRADGEEIHRYLRGETLESPLPGSGWTLVTVDGYPIGWGKLSGGQLKNHYPKGLRR